MSKSDLGTEQLRKFMYYIGPVQESNMCLCDAGGIAQTTNLRRVGNKSKICIQGDNGCEQFEDIYIN